MTTCLGKSCSFGLPQVPFVNCCQFMYLVVSLLVLRAGCGIWLYQFLIISYLFTLLSFQGFMLQGGARGQYLGHHRFCLMSWRLVDGWISYLRCWFSVTQTLTWIGQWLIFHAAMVLPSILKTICWTNAIIGIVVPCDAKNYLIKCMWASDLHFMVQWFCLTSWGLFDGIILFWRC